MEKKAWTQLIILLGEGFILLVSVAFIYVLISRKSGAELLGQYALVLAWLMLFQALGNFGIPEFIMREVGRVFHNESKYISHGLIIGISSSFTAMLVMASAVIFLPYTQEVKKALLLSTFTLIPVMVSATCRGGLLAHKKTEWIFLIAFVESLTIVSINAYLIIYGYGIVPLVLTIMGGKVLSSLLSLYLLNKHTIKLRWEFDIKFCRQLLPPIFTFAMSSFLGLIAKRINVIMLSMWSTLSIVGFYSAANALLEVTLMIPSMFAQLLLPQLARSFSTQKHYDIKHYEKLLYLLFTLTIPLGIGILFFAKPIVEIVFGPQFVNSVIILRVLMVYFLIESVDGIMGVILKAAGHQKADVRIFSINPIANTILNIFLIPTLGAVGAALSKLAGVLFSYSLRYIFVSKRLIRLNWFRIAARPLLISTAMGLCMLLLSGSVPIVILGVIYVFFNGLFLYLTTGFSIRNLKARGQPGAESINAVHPSSHE